MFSQRKSFWKRRWFIITVIAVLGVGYWFSQTDSFSPERNLPEGEEVNQSINTETGKMHGIEQEPGEDTDVVTPDSSTPEPDTFFLIKEINGTIEIYYYEGEGEPVYIKNADIAFSLLSEGDQAMFSEGIIVETEEELDELLQDFGS
jgi:hypothetical protein